MKKLIIISAMLITTSLLLAQHGKPSTDKADSTAKPSHSHQRNTDPRYSVFGPPRPAEWKFQLGYDNTRDGDYFTNGGKIEGASSFNFYRKDQRDKTLFFTIMNNAYDYINQYRVQRLSGGAILFPFNDDDRYQFDFGGVFDKIVDTTFYNKTAFSRFTWRPSSQLWARFGFEYYDGRHPVHGPGGNPYSESSLSSYYMAAKYKLGFFSPVGVIGGGSIDGVSATRYGGGAMLDGPLGLFLFGGYINSSEEEENVRTLAAGRWAPFRPDGLPSAFFIWKHRDDYDFQLGGIFFGRRNRFVRPAAVGMVTGMFVSSITLRMNSQLRQRKLMTISDDFLNADYSVYYVHMNVKIPTGPSGIMNTGFTVIQFFKLFTDTEFWIFKEPVVGLFYNEETNPVTNPITHQTVEETEKYWSFQVGSTIFETFMFNVISEPSRSGWIVAASYLLP